MSKCEPLRPVFQITPQRLELSSGETAEIVLEGISDMCVSSTLHYIIEETYKVHSCEKNNPWYKECRNA